MRSCARARARKRERERARARARESERERDRERVRERERERGRQADRERQRETETGGLKGAERETADTALFKKKKKFFVWMRGVRWFYLNWCLRQRDCGLFCPG